MWLLGDGYWMEDHPIESQQSDQVPLSLPLWDEGSILGRNSYGVYTKQYIVGLSTVYSITIHDYMRDCSEGFLFVMVSPPLKNSR